MDRESIMIQWDMYRKQIAEGDKSSEPRDWFESFLDEIERLEAEKEKIGKKLADDMVSKLSGDELDRYLLKSTSVINKQQVRIKQLEAVLKKVTQLINEKINHGYIHSYGFVLKEILKELKTLEGKDE